MTLVLGQTPHYQNHERMIRFPDVPGYKTLICDLHIHTVFSDGDVWPNIRVDEAIRDGLDVIAITDHLEYQPHKEDIPNPDRNRSHVIASKRGEGHNIIILNGSEITRDMPPGHSNAIFVKDANRLIKEDAKEVFNEAKRQDAFVFWNHPNWLSQASDGVVPFSDMHKDLIKKKLLHGIEVVNENTYSDEAVQIALDYNLTMLGTSDIHGLVDWQYRIPQGGHRPVTLVFAKKKSAEAVKEALTSQRTVVWFNNLLIGRERDLMPLIEASIIAEAASYKGDSEVSEVILKNNSDSKFILTNRGKFNFHARGDLVTLPPHSTITLLVKTLERLSSFDLSFEVMNALTAPRNHPTINFTIKPSLK
ncbi:MAG: Sb-PDE family phosphodiesterase [Candidatus Neomarinimicrobiota bacterium]|nr:Sb-PDE family phosphodiesterase [Candidatus Neomarinimicrobiota bacterium]